jgi:hypothetical protein
MEKRVAFSFFIISLLALIVVWAEYIKVNKEVLSFKHKIANEYDVNMDKYDLYNVEIKDYNYMLEEPPSYDLLSEIEIEHMKSERVLRNTLNLYRKLEEAKEIYWGIPFSDYRLNPRSSRKTWYIVNIDKKFIIAPLITVRMDKGKEYMIDSNKQIWEKILE